MWLETERLYVRDFTEQDIEALYEIKYDEHVLEYIPDFLERDVTKEKIKEYIEQFRMLEETQNKKQWRIYAIAEKASGAVIGSLSFGENELLHEYELGWQMIGRYTRKGYASEAASAFAEHFCEQNGVDYLIVVMDVDNPASYRTAEKSGFKLFEKRTVYDYTYNRYCDDYYYFRRYYSGCTLVEKFYGDSEYTGRKI